MVLDADDATRSLLRALRISRGLTQQEIARRSGVTERSIRDIERATVSRPRTDSLLRIASALGLSAVDTTAFIRTYRGVDGDADETVRTVAPVVAPAELPRDLPDFVGRGGEVQRLVELLHARPQATSSTKTIVISGAGGLGKSSLAIHAGHLAAAGYPDGQVFVDLSSDPSSDTVHDALGELLWSFGMREDIPKRRSSRVRMMRSLTARTRALIVVDDVPEGTPPADVADLVPSGAGNALIITSRSRLSALSPDDLIELTPLTVEQSVDLLSSAAGAAAEDLTPAQSARIARLCGMHPLALRVCGARLNARRGLSATDLIGRLEAKDTRLELLDTGSFGVRSTLVAGVQSLARSRTRQDAAALDALALMAASPLRDFSVDAVAALTRTDRDGADQAIERLSEVQMITSRRPGRLGMHDLSRLAVAAELPVDQARVAAGMRCFAALWLEHWRRAGELFHEDPHCVYEQLHAVLPGYPVDVDSREWLEAEYPNMRAAAAGEWVRTPLDLLSCYQLSYAFHGLALQRGDSESAVATTEAVAARAEAFDLPYVAAHLYRTAAETVSSDGDQESARAFSAVAQRHAERVHDPVLSRVARSHVRSGRALIDGRAGAVDDAERALRDAIRLLAGHDRRRRQVCLHNLAYACRLQGRRIEEARYTVRALAGPSRSYGLSLKAMAELLLELGKPETALRYIDRAAEADAMPHTYRRRADHAVLRGRILRALGRTGEAEEAERTATSLAEAYGFREVYERLGDDAAASVP